MSMPLDEAMEVAREAKEQGRLNRHPLACIVLAEEVLRLRTLCEKENNDSASRIEKHPPPGPT